MSLGSPRRAGPTCCARTCSSWGPRVGSVSNIKDGGSAVPVLSGQDHGRPVSVVTVDLSPGQETTVTAVLTAPRPAGAISGQKILPVVSVTPGVHTWPASVSEYPACRTGDDTRSPVESGQ